jgi:hypothetical protein
MAPDMKDILYPANVLRECPCGWSKSNGCYIPAAVCQHGMSVLRDDARLADGSAKKSAWVELSSAPFIAHADISVVLQVLPDLSGPILSNCSARELSITWGLLAPQQHDAWYAGGKGEDQRTGTWAFGAQHLASAGPGGLRLGMLSPNAPISMQEHVRAFELGDGLEGTTNAYYKHTIAQPVCNKTMQNLLRKELDTYFVDTLIPMAHSVQIVPAVEYCVRWVIDSACSLCC